MCRTSSNRPRLTAGWFLMVKNGDHHDDDDDDYDYYYYDYCFYYDDDYDDCDSDIAMPLEISRAG